MGIIRNIVDGFNVSNSQSQIDSIRKTVAAENKSKHGGKFNRNEVSKEVVRRLNGRSGW